jgi:Uma2 family endonuclease
MNSQTILPGGSATAVLPPRPKHTRVYYPSSDGEPMAETEWHVDSIIDLRQPLRAHFQDDPNVYVAGNMMFYYVKGDPSKCISPDVMVIKGVRKGKRRIFQLWKERVPSVIFEISSRKTKAKDFEEKMELYARLGVPEYYVFDPEQEDPPQAFFAFRLRNGVYHRVPIVNGRIFSPELGLEIVQMGDMLRLFDPLTQEFLPTTEEESALRVHAQAARVRERNRRLKAEARASEAEAERVRETEMRSQAEAELQAARTHEAQLAAEIAQLQAELARLRGEG